MELTPTERVEARRSAIRNAAAQVAAMPPARRGALTAWFAETAEQARIHVRLRR